MKASYREMFDEVRASERLKEEVMNMTKQERTQVVKKVSVSFIIAAALAVILAGTALAAAIGIPETLQDWFGRQWMEAAGQEELPEEQSEMFESLVQPADVTAVSKGISITLDSVAAGERNIWLILKIKGAPEGEWKFGSVSFDGRMIREALEQSEDYAFSNQNMNSLGVMEDGTEVFLLKYEGGPETVNYMEGGELELRLRDIYLESSIDAAVPQGHHDTPVQVHADIEALWVLPFTLEPATDQAVLTAESASVPCEKWVWKNEDNAEPVVTEELAGLRDIQVTSTGLRYLLPERFTEDEDENGGMVMYSLKDMPVLQLSGGMTVVCSGSSRNGTEIKGNWEFPVDLSKAESVNFGDVVIPLTRAPS